MTDNSRKVFEALKAHYGDKITHQQLVAELGVSSAAVSGSVNGLVKKGYAVRNEEVEMGEVIREELGDGPADAYYEGERRWNAMTGQD